MRLSTFLLFAKWAGPRTSLEDCKDWPVETSSPCGKQKRNLHITASLLLDGLKDFEAAHQGFIDGHHGSSVVELATVVRRAEECDELPLSKEFITIFYNLVSPANQIEVLLLQEAGNDVRAEDEGDATVVLCPASNVFVRISPEKITDHAIIGYVRRPHQASHLIKAGDLRRQATVHTHDLVIDETADRHAVEDVTELLPELDVVASLALVVKAVDSSNGGAFMVAPQKEEVLWVLHLVTEEKGDGLQALLATINVVAKEDVVALRRKSTVLKKAKQVVELAMDITAYLQRRLQFYQRTLIQKDRTSCRAECFHLSLWDLDQLSWLAALGLKALFDDLVDFKIFILLHVANSNRKRLGSLKKKIA